MSNPQGKSSERSSKNEAPTQLKATGSRSMSPPPVQLSADPIQRETGDDPVGPGYYAAGQTSREIGFALRHPIAAFAIGSVSSGSLNISTNAVRFSTNDLGLQENDAHEGSEVNAFRHTLWQSEITQEYGADIAQEVGNAHEADPFAIGGDRRNTTTFDTLNAADTSCDLRNNEIGRAIGTANNEAEMQPLALRVLEHFRSEGLWVAQETEDGKFSIVQRRLPLAQYNEARERILQLNNNGFDSVQQGARDEAARQELERMRIRDQFGPKF